MKFDLLNKELISAFKVDEKKIRNEILNVNNLPLIKLRDILLSLGSIYREDLDQNMYLAIIYGGTKHRNKANIALKLLDGELFISIFAKEGLIKQNTCEGVINELRKRIEKYIG